MRHLGRMQAVVGLAVITAFFAACYAVWFHPLADGGARGNRLSAGTWAPALAAAFVAVVQYHYGSSAGSARKDAALASEPPHVVTPASLGERIARTPAPPSPPMPAHLKD